MTHKFKAALLFIFIVTLSQFTLAATICKSSVITCPNASVDINTFLNSSAALASVASCAHEVEVLRNRCGYPGSVMATYIVDNRIQGVTLVRSGRLKDQVPIIGYLKSAVTWHPNSSIGVFSVVPAIRPGTITSCSIAPALPTGLVFNATDCTISGTPTVTKAATNYTITATNSVGSSSTILSIAVKDQKPIITYSGSPYVWTKNITINAQTPQNIGSTINSCTISPALPAGLVLNATTCEISGKPTVTLSATKFSVTATNAIGSGSTTLNIIINNTPPIINFGGTSYTWLPGVAISPLLPNNTGGVITSCTSTPALPAGLIIDSTTCKISGTPPSFNVASANYTITAKNLYGTSINVLTIKIYEQPPNISYLLPSFQWWLPNTIQTQTPTNTGGAIKTCSVSPALPAGLIFNTLTCAISGTPTTVTAAANYTITAKNLGGSQSVVLSIIIHMPVPIINYSATTFSWVQNKAITTLTPSKSGGAISSCTSSPALPAGLTLNNTTCVISGTPTVVSAVKTYYVTAKNEGGQSTQGLTITVTAAPSLDCTFVSLDSNPMTVLNGTSVKAYESDYNLTTCKYQNRTCNSGILSGTYSYKNCYVGPPK